MTYDTTNWISGKDAEILKAVRDKDNPNKRDISKAVDTTYSHSLRRLDKLEEKDLVVMRSKPRGTHIMITVKGSEISKAVDVIKENLKEDEVTSLKAFADSSEGKSEAEDV